MKLISLFSLIILISISIYLTKDVSKHSYQGSPTDATVVGYTVFNQTCTVCGSSPKNNIYIKGDCASYNFTGGLILDYLKDKLYDSQILQRDHNMTGNVKHYYERYNFEENELERVYTRDNDCTTSIKIGTACSNSRINAIESAKERFPLGCSIKGYVREKQCNFHRDSYSILSGSILVSLCWIIVIWWVMTINR